MILGRIAFGTILTLIVFAAWIKLFIFDPDDDEFWLPHVMATVVGMVEHVTLIVLLMKYLIERGVI